MSLSSHLSAHAKTVDWLTPPEIIHALGPFDLDPCCPPVMPWKTASQQYSVFDNGLLSSWSGFVWLNPPFNQSAAWMCKLATHHNGIAFIPSRTETALFFNHVWGVADAILFLKGRPSFHRVDGSVAPFNCGFPMCLIAYGSLAVERLRIVIERKMIAGFLLDNQARSTLAG